MRGSVVKLMQRRSGSDGRLRAAKRKWLRLTHLERGALRAKVRAATAQEQRA